VEEWQKTLYTALSAFAVGVLLEPIRFQIAARLKTSALRRALYDQVGHSGYCLARYQALIREPAANSEPLFDPASFMREVSSDFYTHVKEVDKASLYALSECGGFRRLYQCLGEIQSQFEKNASSSELLPLVEKFEQEAERLCRERVLSSGRLANSIRRSRRRVIARLSNFYRGSHEPILFQRWLREE
jgi:hypothetical protein